MSSLNSDVLAHLLGRYLAQSETKRTQRTRMHEKNTWELRIFNIPKHPYHKLTIVILSLSNLSYWCNESVQPLTVGPSHSGEPPPPRPAHSIKRLSHLVYLCFQRFRFYAFW
jgi:hypothetical protein